MSEKGPFDAAIEVLQEKVNLQEYDDFETSALYHMELEQAIRVLEAAGKVDKKRTLMALEHLPLAGFSAQNIIRDQLYSLVESLPEREKEKK